METRAARARVGGRVEGDGSAWSGPAGKAGRIWVLDSSALELRRRMCVASLLCILGTAATALKIELYLDVH